jgi:glycosyltransferase involved in cell wall biosynthesis
VDGRLSRIRSEYLVGRPASTSAACSSRASVDATTQRIAIRIGGMLIGMAHPAFTTPGGAEILAARHAEYLQRSGHSIRLVTTSFDAARWAQLEAIADIHVVGKAWFDHIGRPGRHPKLRRRAMRQAGALRGVEVVLAENFPANIVAAEVRSARRTVWYCNEPSRRLYPRDGNPHLAARLAATDPSADTTLLTMARTQFARHDSALAQSGQLRVERALDMAAVARITCVIANSGYVAEIVQRVYGRCADGVIYPTVPVVEDQPRRSGRLDPAGLRVLTHSRLEPMKNIGTVVQAFHAFSTKHPGAHELHVVGEGPERPTLRALAVSLGIARRVHFHGFLTQPELEVVSAHCEVMALLPADEPFGMVFPEAAQRGLLLMGPDHGGPLEILDGGALGWPLDIFSPAPLADAFAEAWRLPAAEVDRRRERAASACVGRYAPAATLPLLLRELVR